MSIFYRVLNRLFKRSAHTSRVLAFVGCLFLFGDAVVAHAEEEVRISISSNASSVEISGDDLSVFDGDVGDRLATSIGPIKVSVKAKRGSVKVSGSRLKFEDKDEIVRKLVFFEAPDGIRVDGRLFLGRISVQTKKGRLMVINRLPLETYLLGIVGSEMNPEWPLDALKAQAVAARTYALQRRMMKRYGNRPYDLESTVLSQVYRGAERIRQAVIDAVSLTRGEVLTHEHRLAEALFHATCGGRTHSSREAFGTELPYLISRKCNWCKAAKRYRWKAEIELQKLEKALRKKKLISGRLHSLERKKGQRKLTAMVAGKKVYLSPRAVRVAVGYTEIYSSRFEATTKRGKVRFSGRGFGHGVGMCQWGAHGLSKKGHNYFEILAHYYKGAKVVRIY